MESFLAGRYRLRKRIGAGGMASVWLARDEVLVRQVAVKLIDPELASDPEFRERFRDEARAAAALAHPHIVTVHDYGESDGTPYIVMELLTGTTLADRFPVPDIERVIGQIASALAAAHAARIVHRDIKPNNIFLTPSGVKVLDFGIAGDAGMGTPDYLPPEQYLSPSADVYSLGVVWFEAVRGRRPQPGETLGGLQARCVAPSAKDRPTAAEVAVELGVTGDVPADASTAAAEAITPKAGAHPLTRLLTGPVHRRRRPDGPDRWARDRWRRWPVVAAAGTAALVAVSLGLALSPGDGAPSAALVTSSPSPPGPTASAARTPVTRDTSMTSVTTATRKASPSASATSPAPSPARRPVRHTLSGVTPRGAIDALTRMRRTVDEGMAAREVRPDVAVDLDNVITNLQGELAAGEPVDLRQRVAGLRQKIWTRLREHGLTQGRADALLATLREV